MDAELEIGTSGRSYTVGASLDVLDSLVSVPKKVIETAVSVPSKVISTVTKEPVVTSEVEPTEVEQPPVMAIGQPVEVAQNLFNRIRSPQGSTNFGYISPASVFPSGRPTSVPTKALEMINVVPRKFAVDYTKWALGIAAVIGIFALGTKYGKRTFKKVVSATPSTVITDPITDVIEDYVID